MAIQSARASSGLAKSSNEIWRCLCRLNEYPPAIFPQIQTRCKSRFYHPELSHCHLEPFCCHPELVSGSVMLQILPPKDNSPARPPTRISSGLNHPVPESPSPLFLSGEKS